MSDDEFRADLRWPVDPLGERPPADLADDEPPWSPPADLEEAGPPGERALLEEVGRLSDRLVERMRGLRVAVEADLAEIRSELTAVRKDLSKVTKRAPVAPAGAPAADLEPLQEELAALRTSVDGVAGTITSDRLDDLADELAGLQAEIVSLRRRISLRATGEGPSLSDEQLEQLASAVAAHLRRDGRQGTR
jgi:hypothetical protein